MVNMIKIYEVHDVLIRNFSQGWLMSVRSQEIIYQSLLFLDNIRIEHFPQTYHRRQPPGLSFSLWPEPYLKRLYLPLLPHRHGIVPIPGRQGLVPIPDRQGLVPIPDRQGPVPIPDR